MGVCLEAARNLRFPREQLRKGKPRAKHQKDIEAVRPCASFFQARLSIDPVSLFYI